MSGGAPRLRVAIVMGGTSAEREVSLRSGRAVQGALDPGRFDLKGIEIAPDGRWLLPAPAVPGEGEAVPGGAGPGRALLRLDAEAALARTAREEPVDVAFLALHGGFGEDGTIQGLLEAAGIPYTGSGVLASALAMDKERAKTVVAAAGVRVPRGRGVERAEWEGDATGVLAALLRSPGLPAFVKPPGGGSSLGAGPAGTEGELRARLGEVFERHGDRALVEERLAGPEVTCAVLGNRGRPLRTLPLVEIVPRGRPFFDYEAKYAPGACDEICPARVPEEEAARVREAALAAHRALGCDGMSRSDFILVDGEPCYLETNTIPGLTEASLCPRAARAAGIEFPRLVELLVEMALERAAGPGGGGRERWR